LRIADNLGDLVGCCNNYSLDALILTADAAILVLAILFLLCLNRGAYQRKEQFIIHAIRWQYFQEFNDKLQQSDKYAKIFPKGYNPYGKRRCNFVQGVFWFMMKTFMALTVIILFMTILKIANQIDLITGLISMSGMFVVAIVFCCWRALEKAFEKYQDLEEEYEPKDEQK